MTKFIVWGVALGVGGVLAGVSTVVRGDDRGGNNFQVTLEGFQETPQTVSTTGRGRLTLRIDEDAETISYRLRYSALDETGQVVTQAHIHLGQRATGGGVSAFLCGVPPSVPAPPASTPPLCTTPSGDITGVITPADIIGPTGQGIAPGEFAELVRAIRAGYAYGNVHTTRFPGGEIRGQIGDHDGHDHD